MARVGRQQQLDAACMGESAGIAEELRPAPRPHLSREAHRVASIGREEETFTRYELESLMLSAHWAVLVCKDQEEEAWAAWAARHPEHSPASWRRFWTEKCLGEYRRREACKAELGLVADEDYAESQSWQSVRHWLITQETRKVKTGD